ncbi:NAD(P)/FAD-dependent oxidoreductase [Nonomuraea sp. KC401]|uniref:phytoene desaturase family protein n=1 Tax=unclassified Nonomuraea TaxID=2593643 RepID=UPI0010FD5663|nr:MULTISPECIES: NAD(P)/FAD-dependent oxidoreductase [unclassified Nonomuraea]NBE93761.1 NAD(P)-binding protein [Nonomuraea sp. K271]TLF80726.1 NAD(P)/FAD-dependent oxidoreductase [Nonomuraea sp. KC401]
MSPDAVVVGSGPNGLVAAILLARAGRRVLLLEAAGRFGGGLRSGELTLPGRVHDLGATVMAMTLASPAFRELRLQGVEFAQPPIAAAHPFDDRPAVLVHRDARRTAEGLGRDAGAWLATVGATAGGGLPLVEMLLKPLGPWTGPPSAYVRAAAFGAMAALPATTFARSAFRTAEGRAAIAGMAAHSMLDLRRPITAGYALMLASLAHTVGWPVVRGGSQVLADALVAELRSLGGEAVTGHRVRRLSELDAPTIVLDVTPRQFMSMADLPDGYARRLRGFRYGPGVFKLDWALDGPVPWRDPAVADAGTVHLGGTLEEIVLSEAETAAGRHSPRPYVLLVQPYAADPSRGGPTLWAYCHVPNGSPADMTDAVETQIERYAPGFRDRVLARHAMGPAALEAANPNLVGGDLSGGLASLGQFVRRPVWSPAPWRTPLPGVFLCSSSTPPGPGVHGMGGWQAARLALRP